MLKKLLKMSGIGFLIGVVIGNVIALLTGSSSYEAFVPVSQQLVDLSGGSLTLAVVLQTLFSGLYGAICFGATVFYDIERWPLALATGAHCALIILVYIPVALLLGWVSGIVEILIVASIQLAAFFIIWLILYAAFKKQVKELNEMQEHYQKNNEKKQ